MTFISQLADVSQRVAATASRTAKIRELAECLGALDPDEIEIAVQYLAGELPQGKIGISYAALQAASAAAPTENSTMTVRELDRALSEFAAVRGSGSVNKRLASLNALFASCTATEQEFIVRLLVGELRQGAAAGVMLDAVAVAAGLEPKKVRSAAMYADNIGELARTAILDGVAGLARFQLELMTPIAPMLAQTATDIEEALQQLGGRAAFEWKMDGARIQIHKSQDTIRIYTRSCNEVTGAVPEIVDAVRQLNAREAILDGEAIAFSAAGRPHSFQTTMRRFGRKLNVEALRAELPIQAFFFDCLFLDGTSLVHHPTEERIGALLRIVPTSMQIPRLVTSSIGEARAFYDAAIVAGHEGLMAKALDAPYEAGNRGASWLKLKRAHTLDLVILAAEWGHGRREGKLSNLHLGALDPSTGEYVMLGKTFKGLTDAMLDWQTTELLARETHRDWMTVYVRPELVAEIAFSDLQASPRYPGGLALRLARVKGYRPDKRVEEADTMSTVRKIFEGQQ
jgi:DNA ligase 1